MLRFTAENLQPILSAHRLDTAGLLPLSACRITQGYLLARAGLSADEGSVVMLALPYAMPDTADEADRNISRYAVPCDYHHIAKDILGRLIEELRRDWPGANFAAFADHSPIDERHAAAAAGLGMLGDHGLIITPHYASYVFLAEIITDLPTDAQPQIPQTCSHCGACRAACPVGLDKARCLSALTQKKGELSPDEQTALREGGLVWGCDRCQEVCPHARRAAPTPLAAFRQDRLHRLTAAEIEAMDDQTFSRRAYAWRGRAVILRNLRLLEKE